MAENTIKDILVDFETAKLAKENGYSNGCDIAYIHYLTEYIYDGDPEHHESHKKDEIRGSKFWTQNNHNPFDSSCKEYTVYEAPTQSLLQKWFREKHGIHILILIGYGHDTWFSYQLQGLSVDQNMFIDAGEIDEENCSWPNYEETMDNALRNAFKYIK